MRFSVAEEVVCSEINCVSGKISRASGSRVTRIASSKLNEITGQFVRCKFLNLAVHLG